jgi:hypothetical protein
LAKLEAVDVCLACLLAPARSDGSALARMLVTSAEDDPVALLIPCWLWVLRKAFIKLVMSILFLHLYDLHGFRMLYIF